MERQPWLDNIKFFAIFCVVLGHTLGFTYSSCCVNICYNNFYFIN